MQWTTKNLAEWALRGRRAEENAEYWNCCLLWRNLRGMPLGLMSAYECFRTKCCTARHLCSLPGVGEGWKRVFASLFFFSLHGFFFILLEHFDNEWAYWNLYTNANMHDQENFREALYIWFAGWLISGSLLSFRGKSRTRRKYLIIHKSI